MSRSNPLNKVFNSLDKKRRGLGGPVHPLNSLDEFHDRKASNTNSIVISGTSREEIEKIFGSDQGQKEALRNSDESLRQEEGKSRSKKIYDFQSGYKEARDEAHAIGKTIYEKNTSPSLSVLLNYVEVNGKKFEFPGKNGELKLEISSNGDYISIIRDNSLIKCVSRDSDFKRFVFSSSKHSIIMKLLSHSGYLFIDTMENDQELYSYVTKSNSWNNGSEKRVLHEEFVHELEALRKLSKLAKKDTQSHIVEKSSELAKDATPKVYDDSKNVIRIENNFFKPTGPVTRSKMAGIIHSPSKDDFNVELKHLFKDNKVFTINQADFRTLYNNEWINDTLIDFFIKDEIENAIYNMKRFNEGEIYAFNSFFFNKLMSTKTDKEPYGYYHNVERWLNKLDLLSYNYIILPINENLHWYCALIKGANRMLKSAAENNILKDENEGETESTDSTVSSVEQISSKSPSSNRNSNQVEIYIIDSLRQKHPNISQPLKEFLIGYCKDRHGVGIDKSRIKVYSAKVPKQNNFNDCGIHVIYNVRKWLHNSELCEKVWKSPNSKTAFRSLFVADERNKMRQELRNKLLKLQEIQIAQTNGKNDSIPHASDDEIEVIEFLPSTKNATPQNHKQKEDPKDLSSASSTGLDSIEENTRSDQMDQKSKISGRSSNMSIEALYEHKEDGTEIRNKQIKERLFGRSIPSLFVKFMNDHYLRNQRFDTFETERILALKESLSSAKSSDKRKCEKLLEEAEVDLREHKRKKITSESRPKDEILIIKHYSDSEDLGEGVKRLSISRERDTIVPKDDEFLFADVAESLSEKEEAPIIAENYNNNQVLTRKASIKRRKISKI